MLIASMGVSSPPHFPAGSSRLEIRKASGGPIASESLDDGARVDVYHIRWKVKPLWERLNPRWAGGGDLLGLNALLLFYEGIHGSSRFESLVGSLEMTQSNSRQARENQLNRIRRRQRH